MKSKHSRLVAQLDTVYSVYIRLRDKPKRGGMCVLCGFRPIQCVAHLITRGKYSVRWDDRNGSGQCANCNLRHEYNPQYYTNYWLKAYGQDAYDLLFRQSNIILKLGIAELEEIRDNIKRRMEIGDYTTPLGLPRFPEDPPTLFDQQDCKV